MVFPKDERAISIGDLVDVYRNLHKDAFSIRDVKSRLVVAHGDGFILHNAEVKVSESGRQRVIKEQRKNVHAVLRGVYVESSKISIDTSGLVEAYYNPYITETFINKETQERIDFISIAYFKNNKVFIIEK